MSKYSVSLEKVINDLSFNIVYTPKAASDIYISSQDVHRPGLLLAGFEDYFDPARIQFLGLTEIEYIKSLSDGESVACTERFLSKKPAAVVITRGIELPEHFLEIAKEHEVPVLSSNESTSGCMSATISYLGVELAQRITRHGVLVEVYGEGVLILGDSGVGKSETALELIKRGHRLIADDAVEIRRVSNKSLVGTDPDNIRHFIELRGIGIINASRIFGAGSVKLTEKIDLVINLEQWDVNKVYDRMGLDNQTTEILDLPIPSLTIPVKPGRNLAVIIEVAAMNSRQKKLGYNAAEDLLKKLGMTDDDNDKDTDSFAVNPF
ncbi:MAG: HPr(Ser) kinase/phosphatase [Clostridia bacterium]|nr:HPr(Ser) kinase/phosphatase [Clostridia bacterium]